MNRNTIYRVTVVENKMLSYADYHDQNVGNLNELIEESGIQFRQFHILCDLNANSNDEETTIYEPHMKFFHSQGIDDLCKEIIHNRKTKKIMDDKVYLQKLVKIKEVFINNIMEIVILETEKHKKIALSLSYHLQLDHY